MTAPADLHEVMSGRHRRELVDLGDGPIVMIEPMRFVPVFDMQPHSIVGRPMDDWRSMAWIGSHHGEAA